VWELDFEFFFSFVFFWRNFARSLLVSIKMAKTISVFFFFSNMAIDQIRSL
jgi:hypothetical protein